MHFPKKIDGLGVHARGLVLTPIAHDPVDLLHSFGNVLAAFLVGDGQRFLGVDVEERDGAVAAVAGRRYGVRRQARGRKKRDQAGND